MPILETILILALIGAVLWLVVTFVPMPAPFQQFVIVVVIILIILWLFRQLSVTVP